MFSGIGGFERGIEQSGVDMECIGYVEIDKYARSIYEKHYPNHTWWGDATELNPEELPEFDLLVGGFPCQAFSLAGKRRGFDDSRGTLFFEIARVVKEKEPSYLLLENVKGLLSHDKGNTFKTMLGILSELGYDVEWEVLNSKYFGVPQNRERIFIKGYSRRKCGGEILSAKRGRREVVSEMNLMKLNDTVQGQAIYDSDGLATITTGCGGGQSGKTGLYKVGNKRVQGIKIDENTLATTTQDGDTFAITTKHRQNNLNKKMDNYVIKKCYGSTQKHRAETDGSISPTLTSAMGEGGGHVPMIEQDKPEFVRMHGSNQEHRMISEDTCCALNTHRTPMVEYSKPLKVRTAISEGYVEADVNDGVRLDHPGSNARRGTVQKEGTGTISAKCDWGTVDKDYRIRRLTPKECERLQGFPDDWTKYSKDDELISDTQRYKCCGNAVTVNVIEYLIRSWFG